MYIPSSRKPEDWWPAEVKERYLEMTTPPPELYSGRLSGWKDSLHETLFWLVSLGAAILLLAVVGLLLNLI